MKGTPMNKNVLIASAALITGVATVIHLTNYSRLVSQVAERFPIIDRKIVREAYGIFMKRASKKAYGDMANFTDQKMDEIFLEIVQEITSKK